MSKTGILLLSILLLFFGVYTIPKIHKKLDPAKLTYIGVAPDFSLTNQNNLLISNSTFKDKVYLVSFFFSTCPTICPIMNANLYELQHHFFGNPNFNMVSVSIHPENDTPEILKKYAEDLGVESNSWHFLTGEKEEIYNLANKGFALYVAENDAAAGGFEHAGMVALIDQKGNIRSRKDAHGNRIAFYDALDKKSIQMLKKDISVLLKN